MGTWNSRGLRGSTLEEFINRTNEKYLEQGLALIQKIPTPITPVRIDKEHRSNILEHFFKELKGQIIILSTDEEIVSNYMDVVSDVISNTFVLNHTALGNTEIQPGAYFGGRS